MCGNTLAHDTNSESSRDYYRLLRVADHFAKFGRNSIPADRKTKLLLPARVEIITWIIHICVAAVGRHYVKRVHSAFDVSM